MITRHYKVCVLGGSGGIGQALGLLLKMNPLVTNLAMYDVTKSIPGVALDISHINNACVVNGFRGEKEIHCALCDASVVVMTAGLHRKPNMTRQDLFKSNAEIVYSLTTAIARYTPFALIAIVTNPVNSCVPVASMVMTKSGYYNPAKIFGVTTLDLMRASQFVAEVNNLDPSSQFVPVIGGHAGSTIIPLLSQSRPLGYINDDIREKLTLKIQEAGTEVVKAKAGGGSATLSTAFAAARLTKALLRGLEGETVMDFAYVRSNITDADYFSSLLVFGKQGMMKNLGIGRIDAYEQNLLTRAIPQLQTEITEGVDFVSHKVKA